MKKKNEVAAPGQFTKENVPAMLEVINAQITELKGRFGGNEESLKNDSLDGFGNISNITEVSVLIQAISSVKGREAGYKDAMKDTDKTITLTKYPFKLNGSSSSVWIKCINRQIGEVTFKDEMKRLEAAAALLEKHVSEEQKLANDMSKFADLITLK